MLKATILPNSTLSVDEIPVSDGVLFEEIEFTFPNSWENYLKTAVFSLDDTVISVILDPENPLCTGKNKCHIPYELLTPQGFYLSVFGTLGESRATTTKVFVNVNASGYALGDSPSEPTPNEYEQLIALTKNTEKIAQELKTAAENGEFNGERGEDGEKGEKGEKGESGIYYGTTPPEDPNHPLWINPLGEGYCVEQDYNPQSLNPLSGSAVSKALDGLSAPLEEGIDALTENSRILDSRIEALENSEIDMAAILNMVYPVGSIYISYNHTNPQTLFGGSWTRLQDRFLYGAKSTDTIGTTGGSSTHKLTIDEMPSHEHETYRSLNGASGTDRYTPIKANSGYETTTTISEGGSKAHNNMPPYIKVSIWRRTA